MKTTIYSVMLLLALTGCKESVKSEEVANMEMLAVPAASAVSEAPPSNSTAPEAVNASQKIIKNATLRFETGDLAATAERIGKSVRKYKAQVQNDSESSTEFSLDRNMVVRIPSQHFEAFLADISKGVSYFDVKQISSEDVTEHYIDTEARIKAKKVLEQRYLELIGKAKKVSEVLEIEKELSAIREEIEAKEGQLRYMKSRVAMSTVSIEFYKPIAEKPDATVSYGSKMWNAIKSGFIGLSSFLIDLLYIWLFILIFVIAIFIVRKKLKRKRYAEKA